MDPPAELQAAGGGPIELAASGARAREIENKPSGAKEEMQAARPKNSAFKTRIQMRGEERMLRTLRCSPGIWRSAWVGGNILVNAAVVGVRQQHRDNRLVELLQRGCKGGVQVVSGVGGSGGEGSWDKPGLRLAMPPGFPM